MLAGGGAEEAGGIVSSMPERFWAKVIRQDGDKCWLWVASRNEHGYGKIGREGKRSNAYAHRYSYELNVGPIPAGLLVLHRCDNPACVNPNHLFLGTYADNIHDAIAKGRPVGPILQLAKTHCPQGHEYTPENTTYWHGERRCRACMSDYGFIYRLRKKHERAAG